MNEEKASVPTRGKAPVFLNGLTTQKSYLCIAVRNGEEQKNAVGVRRLGHSDYKLHFWPNAGFFGVTLGSNRYGTREGGYAGDYEGSRGGWEHVQDVMEQMAKVEGTSLAPLEKVVEVLEAGFSPQRHFTA